MSVLFLILIPFKYVLIFIGIIVGIYLFFLALYLLFEYWPFTLAFVILVAIADSKKSQKKVTKSTTTAQTFQTASKNVHKPEWHYFSGDKDKISSGIHEPFYVVQSKMGKCSGVVINDHYLITAYHCVNQETYVELINPNLPSWYSEYHQEGIVEKISEKYDLALIKGSFEKARKFHIYQGPMTPQRDLFVCGAPNHRKLVDCFKVNQVKYDQELIIGEGFTRPGMSGSALVDRKNKIILGILIRQYDDNKPIFIPIEKIFLHLGVGHLEVNRYIYY